MRVSLDVERARQIAEALLADAVPRRWSHTIGVATTAAELAKVLAPESADEIVCAAWLHDIGYAPCLIDTRFHPIDGAAYLAAYVGMSGGIPAEVVGLVAHHTGAAFEAQERGLQHLLAEYAVPEAAKLAILSCADLCTGPDGSSVNPGDRLIEVLTRYPADHPVHRAITKSAPLLVAHARRVLAAAEAARNAEQRQGAPPSGWLRGYRPTTATFSPRRRFAISNARSRSANWVGKRPKESGHSGPETTGGSTALAECDERFEDREDRGCVESGNWL